jgi:hypothetical protein
MSIPTESAVPEECGGEQFIHPGSENILLIVYVSIALGVVSFFTFCVRRVELPALILETRQLTTSLHSSGARDGNRCMRRESAV